MTDNELKVIRQNIACPQFGDDHYGAWGILNLDQRRTIYKMWDELTRQKAEIERLQEIICMLTKTGRFYSTVKAEAIEEFWSRLQGVAYQSEREWSHGEHPMLIELDDAKEIYEEMAGDV